MKKIMNRVEDVVPEMLDGMMMACPDHEDIAGDTGGCKKKRSCTGEGRTDLRRRQWP